MLVIFILSLKFGLVLCDCKDNIYCNWKSDGVEGLKWIPEHSEGAGYLRVQKCSFPNCGSAALASGQLNIRQETAFKFGYKIYGDNRVFLRLSKRVINPDSSKSIFPIWEKWGSWDNTFPSDFTNETVHLSPINQQNYELVFDTYIPFQEAFVAVNGIKLTEIRIFDYLPVNAETTENEQGTSTDYNYIPNDVSSDSSLDFEENSIENDLDNDNDIYMGHTTIVIPNICSSYEIQKEDSEG